MDYPQEYLVAILSDSDVTEAVAAVSLLLYLIQTKKADHIGGNSQTAAAAIAICSNCDTAWFVKIACDPARTYQKLSSW